MIFTHDFEVIEEARDGARCPADIGFARTRAERRHSNFQVQDWTRK